MVRELLYLYAMVLHPYVAAQVKRSQVGGVALGFGIHAEFAEYAGLESGLDFVPGSKGAIVLPA